jgi:glutaminyl-tRNA synthetase
MSETPKSLNFIEHIIEEDLANGFPANALRFRFPPEPNGYLHIGHASSICLNFGLGLRYNAPVNLRFDDTNPIKEEQEYVDAIKRDVEWMGFEWDTECYASDYFQPLFDWALELIEQGKAYVDSQSSEEMAKQKGTPTEPGVNSPYRDRSVAENIELFKGMKEGLYEEGTHVLRAKIDMSSSNMLMRDPIMYRILKRAHHRTNTDWCIYPMYDWTHGESDYIEQVTHSLCTLEFAPHRELYDWFLDNVADPKKIRPKQREFARRNLSHTVVSKRKLLQLVEKGLVNGWDDPRMPTISGLRRRGFTPESIRNFAETIGIAKRENVADVSLLEFHIREHLNKIAPRVMAVLNPLKLVITNYPEGEEEWLQAENNPEDESAGFRQLPFSRELYIEQEDFREEANRKFFRLKLGGEVRLKNAYIIKAESCTKDSEGNILEVQCTYDPKSKSGSGSEESLRKVKGTLHWVSIKHALPVSLKEANINDRFQFQRLGYFNVDEDSTQEKMVFNRTVTLRDTWAKIEHKPLNK